MNGISIVVPVYKAEKTLPELHRRLTDILKTLPFANYEIIFVEDCGGDRSWDVISDLSTRDNHVFGYQLNRNFGQHNALLCGIRAAKYDITITMDDDLQHPPEEIPKLLDKLAEGWDVVYGTPVEEKHDLWRSLASRFTKLALQRTMGIQVARNVSAFRAFRTSLREVFSTYSSSDVSIDVLLGWGTARFSAVFVQHDMRQAGVSNYTLRRLISHGINMVTGFSAWPLRLASMMGFAFTFFGLSVLIFVIGRFLLEGSSVPGFPFLASVIAIFSGVQLFVLGIIGEYLARIHFRSMGRPPMFVRRSVGNSANPDEEIEN